jgi:hypothetical protein
MPFLSEPVQDEIAGILGRYNIPGEDRSFIMEKIEEEVNRNAVSVDDAVKVAQKELLKRGDQLKKQALGAVTQVKREADGAVNTTLAKARNAVQRAYSKGRQEGQHQGLAQAKEQEKSSGPGIFQIVIMVGIVTFAGLMVYREFFSKRD